MPARFCFTVDLDRDVNIEVPGHPEAAGSMDRGDGASPRFSSSSKGLEVFVGILDDLSMPCTFFCEGRTLEVIRDRAGLLDGFDIGLHGYDHENLPLMDPDSARSAVLRGCEAVYDVLGRRPVCFRAPFMSPPEDVSAFLEGTGISVDSSIYSPAASCIPEVRGNVTEVPVAEGFDLSGKKISAYLWPMHEGRRRPSDYAELGLQVPDGGCFVLCDHTWHMVESRKNGIFGEEDLRKNIQKTSEALASILDSGMVASGMSAFRIR